MFYYISGIVAHTEPSLAVIDAGGVGYACHAPLSTISKLARDKQAKLYTYLYIREDAFDIYGFLTLEELSCFRLLISVSGVGPKAALSILSASTPEHLALSIITGDEKALTVAPGIGKKIAQRVILELKDKMAKGGPGGGEITSGYEMPAYAVGGVQEAIAALGVLGYSGAEAAEALRGVDADSLSVEELIRAALKKMVVK